MSIASGIQSLGGVVQRLRADGRDAAHDVVRYMRAVEAQAGASSLDALAGLCRASARTIERLAKDPDAFASHAAAIGDHVQRLCEFAKKCVAATDGGIDAVTLVPPPPFTVRDAAEEKQFAAMVALFVEHAVPALAGLDQALRTGASAGDAEAVAAGIRRTIHTLKAEFGALGMPGPQALCHQAESAIDVCVDAGGALPVDELLRCTSLLTRYVAQLRTDARAECADVAPLLAELRAVAADAGGAVRVQTGGEFAGNRSEFLAEAHARLTELGRAMGGLRQQADDPDRIASARRAFHAMNGVAAFVNLMPAADVAKEATALLDAARSRRVAGDREITTLVAAVDMLRRLIASLDGTRGPERREWQDVIARLRRAAAGDPEPPSAPTTAPIPARTEASVQPADASGQVTLAATFDKLAQIARDAAARTGRHVVFAASGETIELERIVAARLDEALVHLVRNAVVHGIERSEERVAAGKPVAGRVSASAERTHDAIVIEVRDDGRGLDRARIVEQAAAAGLLPPGTAAASLSDAQVFELILAPGFSTATEVTELSGRGVGLDVVRAAAAALHGALEIDSRSGGGTAFRVRVPLARSFVDCVIVGVGNHRYVVPTRSIERVFRPARADVHTLPGGTECVVVRGTVVPLHRLKHAFALADGADDPADGLLLAVAPNGSRSCVLVDDVLGRQYVAVQPLAGTPGVALLRDGSVASFVDVGALTTTGEGARA